MKYQLAACLLAVLGQTTETEQNNSINDAAYNLASGNSLTYLQQIRGSTRDSKRASSFRNRYSSLKKSNNVQINGLFDRKTNEMIITAGCHFKPSTTFIADHLVQNTAQKNENKDMTGVFAMQCTLTNARNSGLCQFFARAEGFFWDRANADAVSNALELYSYFPTDSNIQAAVPYSTGYGWDPRLMRELGNIRTDHYGKPSTYEHTGSCDRNKFITIDAAGASTTTIVGRYKSIDTNNLQPLVTYPSTAEYYDSHFLSLQTNYDIGGTGQVSSENIDWMWVQIRAPNQQPGFITTPLGCCKVERWSGRSYVRYRAKVERYQTRVCNMNSKEFILNAQNVVMNQCITSNTTGTTWNVDDLPV